MRDLGRAEILGAEDFRIEKLYVPEWKGNVYLRTITGTQRDRFEAALVLGGKQTNDDVRAKFLVEALCDAGGTPIFTQEDIAALGAKSAAGLTRCYNKASAMNALSNGDVDDIAKNSGGEATDIL
jgi:hypothetical protein